MLAVLLNLTGKIALLIAVGYFLSRKKIITEEFQKGLTDFMMKVALPANVMTTAGNAFSPEESKNLLLVAAVGLSFHLLTLVLARLISRRLPLSERGRDALVVMAVFANTAFIGFPLASELMGSKGLLYAVVFNLCWLLTFFTIGISIFSGQRNFSPRAILKVPVTAASFLAIVIYVSPLRLSGFVLDAVSTLGGMVVPISMMIIGCSLVKVNPLDILRDLKSWMVSLLRLIVFPLLMLLLMRLIPGIPNMVKLTCCLMSSLPSASLCVVMAQQYDCEPVYTSRAVVQGMLLMIVTIPLYLGFAASLFPVI